MSEAQIRYHHGAKERYKNFTNAQTAYRNIMIAYDEIETLKLENAKLANENVKFKATIARYKARGGDKKEDTAMIKELYQTVTEFEGAIKPERYKKMLRESYHSTSRWFHLKKFMQGGNKKIRIRLGMK